MRITRIVAVLLPLSAVVGLFSHASFSRLNVNPKSCLARFDNQEKRKYPASVFHLDSLIKESSDKDVEKISVDSIWQESGGWGNFQQSLAIKLGLVYSCLGADMLLPAFLTPKLAQDMALTQLQQQYIGSSWFLGAMVGFFLTGALGDSYGRRPILLLCSTIRTVSTLSLAFMPSFDAVLVTRFISSIGTAGAFKTLLPLLFEFAPPDNRAGAKQYLAIQWNVGVFALCIGAWLLKDLSWRYLCLIFIPSIPITLWLFQNLYESPKYLVSVGKLTEAKAVLTTLANVNNATRSTSIERLRSDIMKPTASNGDLFSKYGALFSPAIIKNTLLIALLNFVLTLTYYGLAFSNTGVRIEDSVNSIYSQQLLASVFEIPGLLLISPLANILGRRTAIISLILSFTVSLLALLYLPPSMSTARLGAYLLARLSGQAASTLKWVVNAEAYPTSCRNAGLGFASLAGQLGGLAGPLLILHTPSPLGVFAGLLAATALAMFMLEETKGKELN